MKRVLKAAGVALLLLFIYAAWIKYRSFGVHDGGPPLAIRWEGFYHDMNYRDIGASLNQCLNEPVYREGLLFRSAGWFSGWDCSKVGNPRVIYSLNYSPEKEERYFCHAKNEKVIGRYFNPDVKLNNLEYLRSWSDPKTRDAVCGFLKDIFISVLEEKRTLLHCDAGRDRTGTVSALLVALAAENVDRLDGKMLKAIECDYRKTESLDPDKHGRMEEFIRQVKSSGSVSNFIATKCHIDPEIIPNITSNMLIQ